MECLERRRSVLGNLTELWGKGMSAELLESAIDGARGLPPIEPCADARALTERVPLPSDAATVSKVAATRVKLDAVHALTLANRRPEARAAAAEARADADTTGWPQVRAEAAMAEGLALTALEDRAAEPRLVDAARLAGAAHDDRLAAEALIELVQHLAEDQQSAERALLVAGVAEGVVLRAGDDLRQRLQLMRFRGAALRTKGAHREAREVLTEALKVAEATSGTESEAGEIAGELARVAELQGNVAEALRLGEQVLAERIARFGQEHPRVAAQLNNLGLAFEGVGDSDSARHYYRRALAIKEKVLGPDSASTALTLNNLGAIEIVLGHLDEGQPLLERALAVRERVLGPEHPYVATTLGNLAIAHRKRGRIDEALAMQERALAIKIKAYGPIHNYVGNSVSDLGRSYASQGNHARALELFRRALDIRKQALGAEHPKVLSSINQMSTSLIALGRMAEARPLLQANLRVLEKLEHPEPDDFSETLALIAECELASGSATRANTLLDRALQILTTAKASPAQLGVVRWSSGRALWALGRRTDALAAVRMAEHELASEASDPQVAGKLAAARAWLAARKG
jgi:eukaryotic-like serine/threonine-protein kinase